MQETLPKTRRPFDLTPLLLQSEGNIDHSIYSKKGDSMLELTPLGRQQASFHHQNKKTSTGIFFWFRQLHYTHAPPHAGPQHVQRTKRNRIANR